MAYYTATIQVLIDVDDHAAAADAITEALRPLLRRYDPASSLIDWCYHHSNTIPHGPWCNLPRAFEE